MPVAPGWREPAHYRFDLEAACNRGPSMGRFEVEVAGGRVVTLRRTQPDGSTDGAVIATLGELLDRARGAKRSGGEAVIVQDPADGHPVIVTFNMSGIGADVATCY